MTRPITPEDVEEAWQKWNAACDAVDALPYNHPDGEKLSVIESIANRELYEIEIAFYAQQGVVAV